MLPAPEATLSVTVVYVLPTHHNQLDGSPKRTGTQLRCGVIVSLHSATLRVTLCFVGSGEGNPLAADDAGPDLIQLATAGLHVAVLPSERTVVVSEGIPLKECNSLMSSGVRTVDGASRYEDEAYD